MFLRGSCGPPGAEGGAAPLEGPKTNRGWRGVTGRARDEPRMSRVKPAAAAFPVTEWRRHGRFVGVLSRGRD